MLDMGVQSVHLDGERVRAIGMRKALGAEVSADDVLALVEQLALLAREVDAFAARHEVRPSPKNDPLVVGSWITLGLLGLFGFAMLMAGAIEYTLVQPASILLPCALLGLPTVAPVVFVLALALQRRSSPYGLLRGLAALALVVVPLSVSGVLLLSNGVLDDAPADEHVLTVVGKSARENSNKMRYHAGLASWWTEGDVRWLRVSKATYDTLEPHVSRMRVRTRPGKLGFAWLEDYTVLP